MSCLGRFALSAEDDLVETTNTLGFLKDNLRDVWEAPSQAQLSLVLRREVAPVTGVILWIGKNPADGGKLLSQCSVVSGHLGGENLAA